MTALSAIQSCAQTFIHNVIMFFDTSNNAFYSQVHWLIGTPYLSIKASNGYIYSHRCGHEGNEEPTSYKCKNSNFGPFKLKIVTIYFK